MSERRYLAFRTNLKWFAVQWSAAGVSRVTIGHRSKSRACAIVKAEAAPAISADMSSADMSSADMMGAKLRQRLTDFAAGLAFDLRDIPLDLPAMTPFQQRVIDACREIPYGETLSYAQLATLAGSPRAARAVGNVMAHNRVPILVPCHRVVGSQQTLGGFSAPSGLTLKRQMLELEAKQMRCDGRAADGRAADGRAGEWPPPVSLVGGR